MTGQQELSNKLSSENAFFIYQVLIAGTFKGMEIRPGSFGKASPTYDVQVNISTQEVKSFECVLLCFTVYFVTFKLIEIARQGYFVYNFFWSDYVVTVGCR